MAQVRLLGWKASGLRCPDHEISRVRADGTPHHVSLIQMPNGTGKTTVHELIRAALSGPEAWTDVTESRSLRPGDPPAAEGILRSG
jgi:ABC-type branched-subunit amino acid transport system ATPase component